MDTTRNPLLTIAYPPAALPDVLPGEDRAYGAGLFVDLIPQTSWFRNVRAAVAPADWDQLRRTVYRRAGYRCEACGTSGVRLEAHERFTYDARSGVQRLMRLLCLCAWCHIATHMGMAGVRGVQDLAFGHLMAVTGMTEKQAEEHVDEAFTRWAQRSRIAWRVDLSMIAAAAARGCARGGGRGGAGHPGGDYHRDRDQAAPGPARARAGRAGPGRALQEARRRARRHRGGVQGRPPWAAQ